MRKRMLPYGWYPQEERDCRDLMDCWDVAPLKQGVSCIVPHAGWSFSGSLAFKGISSLEPKTNIILCGGHLPQKSPILSWPEECVETPLGEIIINQPLIHRMSKHFSLKWEQDPDNSLEIHLPILRYFQHTVRLIPLRLPPDRVLIPSLMEWLFQETKGEAVVIGSADLTHYGPNYQFILPGNPSAEEILEGQDKDFLTALTRFDYSTAYDLALQKRASCSAGAAAAAAHWAQLKGRREGEVLEMKSSYHIHPGKSFVGYGVVSF